MGHYISFFSVTFITLVAFSSGADPEFTVKILERKLLACSVASDPGNLKHVNWYLCSSNLEKNGCDSDGEMVLIAQVKTRRGGKRKNVLDQNFDVYDNGTLVIKEVIAKYDGKMFLCFATVDFKGRNSSPAILNIDEEPLKLIPKGSLSIKIFEGTNLYMDAEVGGYPCPNVTWSRNEVTLQNTQDVCSETSLLIRSVTADEKGRYTCFASNRLGNTSFTVDVKVLEESLIFSHVNDHADLGQLVTTTATLDICTPPSSLTSETQSPSASLPPNIQSPSAPPPPETPGPSASPFPEKEDGEVFNWLTGLLAGLLVISLAINIYLVVKIWKPDLHTPDDTRGVINSTFQADSNVDGSAEELDNIPNQEQRKKEVGGGET